MDKKDAACLYMAARKVGLSYRSACKRGIERCLLMKKQGLLYLTDNKKDRGRFIFRITNAGSQALDQYNKKAETK